MKTDEAFEDDLFVPDDAGEYRDALVAVLRRFSDDWPAYLSCNAGWYPLLTALDRELAALAPDYVLYQIKEKYGTLRYYAELPPAPDLPCCLDFEAHHPRPPVKRACGEGPQGTDAEALAWWSSLYDAHTETAEHIAAWKAGDAAWCARQEQAGPEF